MKARFGRILGSIALPGGLVLIALSIVLWSEFSRESFFRQGTEIRRLSELGSTDRAAWSAPRGTVLPVDEFAGNLTFSDLRLTGLINSPDPETDGVFTPDGRYLVFASQRSDSEGGFDLYWSEVEGQGFSLPQRFPSSINSIYHERSPSLAVVPGGGYLLAFTSNRSVGSALDHDVFLARGSFGDDWTAPLPIPGAATQADERSVALLPSGDTIVFSKPGPTGIEYLESWAEREGRWSAPRRLRFLSHADNEPRVVADASRRGFAFLRDQSYWASELTVLRPVDLAADSSILPWLILLAAIALLVLRLLAFRWAGLAILYWCLLISLVIHLFLWWLFQDQGLEKPEAPPSNEQGTGAPIELALEMFESESSSEAAEAASGEAVAVAQVMAEESRDENSETQLAKRDRDAPAATAPSASELEAAERESVKPESALTEVSREFDRDEVTPSNSDLVEAPQGLALSKAEDRPSASGSESVARAEQAQSDSDSPVESPVRDRAPSEPSSALAERSELAASDLASAVSPTTVSPATSDSASKSSAELMRPVSDPSAAAAGGGLALSEAPDTDRSRAEPSAAKPERTTSDSGGDASEARSVASRKERTDRAPLPSGPGPALAESSPSASSMKPTAELAGRDPRPKRASGSALPSARPAAAVASGSSSPLLESSPRAVASREMSTPDPSNPNSGQGVTSTTNSGSTSGPKRDRPDGLASGSPVEPATSRDASGLARGTTVKPTASTGSRLGATGSPSVLPPTRGLRRSPAGAGDSVPSPAAVADASSSRRAARQEREASGPVPATSPRGDVASGQPLRREPSRSRPAAGALSGLAGAMARSPLGEMGTSLPSPSGSAPLGASLAGTVAARAADAGGPASTSGARALPGMDRAPTPAKTLAGSSVAPSSTPSRDGPTPARRGSLERSLASPSPASAGTSRSARVRPLRSPSASGRRSPRDGSPQGRSPAAPGAAPSSLPDSTAVARLKPRPAEREEPSVDVVPWVSARSGAKKVEALERFGGDEKTERAVAAGLEYLASIQRRNGSWGQPRKVDEKYGETIVGTTAISTLAFLGAGHHPGRESEYQDVVRESIDYLLETQTRRGHFGLRTSAYSHGIATYALGEAYLLTRDEALRPPLELAVKHILRQQELDSDRPEYFGGWGYYYDDGHRYDRYPRVSVTVWQIMAVETATFAGLEIDPGHLEAAKYFLENSWTPRLERFLYNRKPTRLESKYPTLPGSTPAATFALIVLGSDVDSAPIRGGLRFVADRPPLAWREGTTAQFIRNGYGNPYFWYYGTLAMFMRGGEGWDRWNERLKATLLPSQRDDGSWSPISIYSEYAGDSDRYRAYTTALNVLMLEVYYRYLTPFLKSSSERGGSPSPK